MTSNTHQALIKLIFPMEKTVISGRCCSQCYSSKLSTWTAAQTLGLLCQKWLLDRGSEAALANLMETQLIDAAFHGFLRMTPEAFHQLLDM